MDGREWFMDSPEDMGVVGDILKKKEKAYLLSFSSDTKVQDAIAFEKHGISQAPVMKEGKLLGVYRESSY